MRDTIVFLSDFHLGLDGDLSSIDREKKLIRFFDSFEDRLSEVFLVGDVFDFWFEYRQVAPKGAIRFLGKMSELSDCGVRVHFFHGNHDMWMYDYLKTELGATIHTDRLEVTLQGKRFFIAHGDGLGPDDKGYKRLKKVFRHPLSRWLYHRLHPDLAISIARYWSRRSRLAERVPKPFDESSEWLIQYARRKMELIPEVDYFIFGHRHLPIDYSLSTHIRYINLGEWLSACTYAVLQGGQLTLKSFENPDFQPFPRVT